MRPKTLRVTKYYLFALDGYTKLVKRSICKNINFLINRFLKKILVAKEWINKIRKCLANIYAKHKNFHEKKDNKMCFKVQMLHV